MNSQIVSHRQKIDYILSEIASVSNDEIKAHMSKYLCVLISGYIENAVRLLLDEYVRKRSNENVATFVSKKIKRLNNLNENDILELLGIFSSDWAEKFSTKLTPEQKDAFDTVVANRNLIAHGASSGISYIRIKEYYPRVVQGIEIIDNIINKP